MQLYRFIYLFLVSSTCFGRCLHPSTGACDCIYSFWCCPPMLLPVDVMDEMELLVMSTDVGAGWCHGWYGNPSMEF